MITRKLPTILTATFLLAGTTTASAAPLPSFPTASSPAWRQHAFVYANGVMTDLNLLVADLAGWELTVASDINEAGQILGTACQGGSCASVLLTPVPEASAGLMLLAGLGALLPLMARRRTHCAAAEVTRAVRAIHEIYPTNGGIS